MIKIGAQLSCARGFDVAIHEAGLAGLSTIQIFSRSPVGGQSKDLPPREQLRHYLVGAGVRPLFVHAPYFVNPAAVDPDMQKRARRVLSDEMQRVKQLSGDYLVLHPGHRQIQDSGRSLRVFADLVIYLLSRPGRILIENAAGQGKEQGGSFQDLAVILSHVGRSQRVGLMLDTAHAMAYGFPLRTRQEWQALAREIERTVGLSRIRGVHLNDSAHPPGSRRDAHTHLLTGQMGEGALKACLETADRWNWPLILETPGRDVAARAGDLAVIRQLLRKDRDDRG